MAIGAFFLSIILSATTAFLLLCSPIARWLLDRPNQRSLHCGPTPRIGGMAILVAVTAALTTFRPPDLPLTPLLLSVCLLLVSQLDDRSQLPAALRLVFHFAAAIFIVFGWLAPDSIHSIDKKIVLMTWNNSNWPAIGVILAICWMTNLFNFMDGANGMAGGMAFIGFGGLAIAASLSVVPNFGISVACAAISGAAVGFLCFNFPSGRIFLGDAGSVPMGFLAAVFSIHGAIAGSWPWWFGILVFSPFIVDATVTLIKRMLKQEKLWVAHREHYYQRLILRGWSHRKTAVSYYILMLGSTLSALAAQNSQFLYPIAGFWVITYASLLLYLEWLFRKYKKVN